MAQERFVAYGLAAATLLSLAVPSRAPANSSKVDTTILNMGEANKRLEIYMLKWPHSPPTQWSDVYGGEPAPQDSWGATLILQVPGPNGRKYDMISYGADGEPGVKTGCMGTYGYDYRWSEQF